MDEIPYTGTGSDAPPKKAPRKPRPSEIAAKKAKAAAAKKLKPKAKKKVGRGAPRKKVFDKPKKMKRKPRVAAKKPAQRGAGRKPLVRTERMDLRLTKEEKAKIMARVKKTGGTATDAVMHAIAKVRW